jgi:uncharacterized protein
VVSPGQFLERPVAIATPEGHALDGLFHRGVRGPACVLAAPHPALGGSMNVPAINELAWALTRGGHPTLRFDYRGVGASQGTSRHQQALAAALVGALPRIEASSLEGEAADLRAASAQLEETALDTLPEPELRRGPSGRPGLCVLGYSFGACVALADRANPLWERLILIAPPTALCDLQALASLRAPLLVVCAQHDPLCDRALLQRWLEPLGEAARLEVIAHADHGFRRGAVELGQVVAEWLRMGRPRLRLGARAGEVEPAEAPVELELEEDGGPPLELDDGR